MCICSWAEYSGRKVDTTWQQWMRIVFVLDGIFRPSSWYIISEVNECRNIFVLAGLFSQESDYNTTINDCTLYLFWTESSESESWYNITTINAYLYRTEYSRPESWYNASHQCVFHLYWTEYSDRKDRLNNKYILCMYLTVIINLVIVFR